MGRQGPPVMRGGLCVAGLTGGGVVEGDEGGVVVEASAGVGEEVVPDVVEQNPGRAVGPVGGALGQRVEVTGAVAGLDDAVGIQQQGVAGLEGRLVDGHRNVPRSCWSSASYADGLGGPALPGQEDGETARSGIGGPVPLDEPAASGGEFDGSAVGDIQGQRLGPAVHRADGSQAFQEPDPDLGLFSLSWPLRPCARPLRPRAPAPSPVNPLRLVYLPGRAGISTKVLRPNLVEHLDH